MRFNLKEIFGIDLKGNSELRLAMAQALLDKILDKKYSKAYRASDAFKAAGKSSKVNLRLSGDMLGLIEATSETANTVTLSWEDSEEAAKAHGHITGGGRLPVRDFFGLNKKDIIAVKREFKQEIADIKDSSVSDKDKAIAAFIEKIDG